MRHISLKLPDELWAELARFADERSTSASAVIREALQSYLDLKGGATFDARRIAVICEFTQLVADEWLRKSAPERRADLLAAVDARLEKYHGR